MTCENNQMETTERPTAAHPVTAIVGRVVCTACAVFFAIGTVVIAACSVVVEKKLDDPKDRPSILGLENERGQSDPDYVLSGERVKINLQNMGAPGTTIDYLISYVGGTEQLDGTAELAADHSIKITMPIRWPTGEIEITLSKDDGALSVSKVLVLARLVIAVESGGALTLTPIVDGESVGAVELTEDACSDQGELFDLWMHPDGRWLLLECVKEPSTQPKRTIQAVELPSGRLFTPNTESSGYELVSLQQMCFQPQAGVSGFANCSSDGTGWNICKIDLDVEAGTVVIQEMTTSSAVFSFARGNCALNADGSQLLFTVQTNQLPLNWRLAVYDVGDAGLNDVRLVHLDAGQSSPLSLRNPGLPVGVYGFPEYFLITETAATAANPEAGLLSIRLDTGETNDVSYLEANVPTDYSLFSIVFNPEHPDVAFASISPRTTPRDQTAHVWEITQNEDELSYDLVKCPVDSMPGLDGLWARARETQQLVVWSPATASGNPQMKFWHLSYEPNAGVGEPRLGDPTAVEVEADVFDLSVNPGRRSMVYVATEEGLFRFDLENTTPTKTEFVGGSAYRRVLLQP
jgi:hypothetical protein